MAFPSLLVFPLFSVSTGTMSTKNNVLSTRFFFFFWSTAFWLWFIFEARLLDQGPLLTGYLSALAPKVGTANGISFRMKEHFVSVMRMSKISAVGLIRRHFTIFPRTARHRRDQLELGIVHVCIDVTPQRVKSNTAIRGVVDDHWGVAKLPNEPWRGSNEFAE
jgi:hypothetical protein